MKSFLMRGSFGVLFAVIPVALANAEPIAINQNAWLNYAIVVTKVEHPSNLQIGQIGTVNGISSAQASGLSDAYMMTHQRGKLNGAFLYQSGWNAVSGVVQEDSDWPGHTRHTTVFNGTQTDEGYLSYFATGGFSLVTLTDTGHTWFSRFGRGR